MGGAKVGGAKLGGNLFFDVKNYQNPNVFAWWQFLMDRLNHCFWATIQ